MNSLENSLAWRVCSHKLMLPSPGRPHPKMGGHGKHKGLDPLPNWDNGEKQFQFQSSLWGQTSTRLHGSLTAPLPILVSSFPSFHWGCSPGLPGILPAHYFPSQSQCAGEPRLPETEEYGVGGWGERQHYQESEMRKMALEPVGRTTESTNIISFMRLSAT